MLGLLDALVLVAICVCTAAAVLADHPMPLSDLDIFFMEAALAVALGFIVFRYSRQSDLRLQSHLSEVKSMLQRREKTKQIRKTHANKNLCTILTSILSSCHTLVELGDRHANVPASESQQPKSDFSRLHRTIEASVGRLGRELEHANYLEGRTYDDIAAAIAELDMSSRTTDSEKTLGTEQCQAAIELLGPVLHRLERRIDPGIGAHSLTTSESTSPPGRLVVRLGHDIYPPAATVRATVTSDGPFPSKKVTISVLDDGLEVLAKKTKKTPPPDAPDAATLTEDIRPKGTAAGGEYMVRAVCGGLAAEAAFVVEQIPPAVQTDKSIYLMDSDIIVTVIDPAASTGGKKKGHVGNRKNSRLVIESPHGKIDRYSLQETEPSSGIFQGLVRCMGVRVDGSPRGTMLDDKYADRTHGKGAEDGVIACGPGQPIQIRYTSESGTASSVVIAGGFGSAIELDRTEYTCISGVEICLISPDFSSGEGDHAASIGDDRSECRLSISTSEGRLDGYRLVESEPGSSVFMGTISLTGLAGMKNRESPSGLVAYGRTGGVGPTGGMLACRPEDTLRVSFTSGFEKPVRREVPIRWHVGAINFSRPPYLPGEEIVVRVEDRDMSTGRGGQGRFQVRAWSSSDRDGIRVTVIETDDESGVFEGRFRTGGGPSLPEQSLLRAADGDTVRAEYVDETLPPPHGADNSIVVSASTVVTTSRSIQSPLERLAVDEVRVQGETTGDGTLAAGEKAQVTIRARNPGREISFTAILQTADQDGVTVDLQCQPLTARLHGYAAHTFSWIPGRQGTYNITVFLWNSIDDPVAYSRPASRQVEVLDPTDSVTRPKDGHGNPPTRAAGGGGGGGHEGKPALSGRERETPGSHRAQEQERQDQ